MSAEDIERAVPNVSRSTINRRLIDLVTAKAIIPIGEGSRRKYMTMGAVKVSSGAPIPYSKESQAIRSYLDIPRIDRKPIGYQRDLVENYIPNVSFILPAALRQKLAIIGKTEHERPAGTHARDILSRLLVDLSWASSRLEGNTYSLLDTKRLIEQGIEAEGKKAMEALMIMNHKTAIEFMIDSAADIDFTPMYVRNIHACLAEGLLKNPASVGALRTGIVEIEGSTYLPPNFPQLIEEMFPLVLRKAATISDPFEQSIFALAHIAYLQPFEDVNKRTSRMCCNIPMIRHNLCPMSFVDVSEHDYVSAMLGVYEKNDFNILIDVYEWAYERSVPRYKAITDSMGLPDPFLLRYRMEIDSMIKNAVINKEEIRCHESVPANDKMKVEEIAKKRLKSLNEGNFARFGITPLQYEAWSNKKSKSRPKPSPYDD